MQHRTPHPAPPHSLPELLESTSGAELKYEVPDLAITGITTHSQEVERGDLFVAIRGTRADGHDFIADAVARGAAAVVVEREPEPLPAVPVLRVERSRRLLAELSAAWFGHPARELPLVGITGTMGKTSVLSFIETILGAAQMPVGSVGSLGVRCGGQPLEETGHTLPGPLVLHRVLRELLGKGCRAALMEATTHALTQDRLRGVEYGLGVFTGLVPLEHMEYHDSFRSYVDAKLRYFDHLQPGSPLIYFSDDLALRSIVAEREVLPVPCGTGADAAVRVQVEKIETAGTMLRLSAPGGVPGLDGAASEPFDLRLQLPLLGHSTATNATLAAAAAAALGATPAAIEGGLTSLQPVRRRMQIVQREPFIILDDFGGHPNTVTAVFEVISALPWRRLHVVSGYRGTRGVPINRGMARALAIWAKRSGCESFFLTAAEETSDERNWAQPEERSAFQEELRREGVSFVAEDRMDRAIQQAVERVGEGDLLLILGTQGMDGAAAAAQLYWAEAPSP